MQTNEIKLFSRINVIIVLLLSMICLLIYYTYTSFDNIKLIGSSLFVWLNKQNPMVAGAISLWALGSASFFARGIPKSIWEMVVKQTTVTLTLNNVDDVYDNFLRWYHTTGRSSKSRTLVAKNQIYSWYGDTSDRGLDISSGYGTHYFMFDGKPFRFVRELKDANNTKEVKESIYLTTFGRSQIKFHQLLIEITPKKVDKDLTQIYKWNGNKDGYWKSYARQPRRKFSSVILPKETKNEIVEHIDTFLNSREWYMKHGIPYRTGVILYGMPGTGKTSLVRALCDKFEKPLYILSLSGIRDDTLEEALALLPRNSLLLIEDIDTYSVTKSRDSNDEQNSEEFSMLSLSGLLNVIDGIMASDGRILIATTNHINQLDSALTRRGRFNISVEIGYLTHDCFKGFFDNFYPDFVIPSFIEFNKHMAPATLQAIIMDNIGDPEYVLKQCVEKIESKIVKLI